MALAVSLLFVVFAATVTYFSISYFEDKTKKTLADQQYLLACTIAHDIDDKLVMLQNALVAASKNIAPSVTTDQVKAQRFVDERVTLHALFDTTVFILDRKGAIVAESPALPERSVFNLSFRDYFQKTVTTGKPVISTPYLSSLPDHRPVVMLTAPVFDSTGKLVCILCGGMRLLGSNLLSDLNQSKVGTTGYIILSTSDNIMIMHPDHSRILKTTAPPGANKLFDRALQGFDGSGKTVNSRGIPMLSSFKHLTATNWIVGVNFPIREAYAPMYRTRQFLVGGIAAGTIAMLMIAWLVMKRLTAPLQDFTRHVAALPGKKGAQKRVPIVSEDEIGTLARAFNDMVTALDAQQEALRESENNFRTLAETSCDGMLVIIDGGTYAYANQRIAEITGYSVEELCQLGIRELAHPDDVASIIGRFNTILSGRKFRRQYETRMVRKVSEEVPVEISSALTLWRGEPAVLVTVRDISERKRVEKALRDSHTLLQKTFASLNEAVFIVETGTRKILDCNRTVETMFGYSRSEIVGATTSCLHLTEEMSDRFGREMLNSYAEQGFFEIIYQMKRKDGTVFDSEHFVTPIRGDNGEIVSHVCVVRDITERMRAETAIINLNRDLQQRAHALAAVNSQLEAFGYSLSHDLKGPLTAIYSGAQVLQQLFSEQLDETGRFCIDSICQASERMDELMDAMLLLSKISRSDLKYEEIDLSDIATGILTRLHREEPDRRAECAVSPDLRVMGDRRLLKSALDNLLGNAWKYSRKKEMTQIEFGMTEENGMRTFFVRDNGAGFSRKNSEKMFLPFQRLHQEKEFEGTGIGLATVQRIIQRHGGEIWAEGEPDKGATFYFTLREA